MPTTTDPAEAAAREIAAGKDIWDEDRQCWHNVGLTDSDMADIIRKHYEPLRHNADMVLRDASKGHLFDAYAKKHRDKLHWELDRHTPAGGEQDEGA